METKTSINQRVAELIKELEKGNQSAFGRKIDLSSGTIAGIIGAKQAKPGFEILQKICLAYPTVRLEWLLLGKGSMLEHVDYIGKYPVSSTDKNTVVPIIYSKDRNRLKWDYLRRNEGSDAPEFTKYNDPFDSLSLPPALLESGQHIVFPMSHRAMYPTFVEDDLLLFSLLDPKDWAGLPASVVCAIEIKGTAKNGAAIEICRPVVDAKAKNIKCEYDNRDFAPRRGAVAFNDIQTIWTFTWRLTAVAHNVAEQVDSLESSLNRMHKVVERLLQDDGEPAYRQRLSRLVLEWSPVNLSMDAEDFLKDKEVKTLYERDYGLIESREKYEALIMSDVEELIKRHDSASKSKQAHVPIRRLGDSNRS